MGELLLALGPAGSQVLHQVSHCPSPAVFSRQNQSSGFVGKLSSLYKAAAFLFAAEGFFSSERSPQLPATMLAADQGFCGNFFFFINLKPLHTFLPWGAFL